MPDRWPLLKATRSARRAVAGAVLVALSGLLIAADPAPRRLGEFQDHRDVGAVARPGSAEYDAGRGEYRVTGGGENIWGRLDAFHFVWREWSGDLAFTADVSFIGEGKDPHRKACLMVRQGPAADAPYADVAVHGDGLVSLQFRREKGGPTEEVQSKVKAPATVRLRRERDVFTLWVAAPGKPLEKAGSATVALGDPVCAGLAVSAHDPSVTETAVFSRVTLAR